MRRIYIKPCSEVVAVLPHAMMQEAGTWSLQDENGNNQGGGAIVEGDPDGELDARPGFSVWGDWEEEEF